MGERWPFSSSERKDFLKEFSREIFMFKINKIANITLAISVVFLSNTALYPAPIARDSLRVPHQSSTYTGRYRLKKAFMQNFKVHYDLEKVFWGTGKSLRKLKQIPTYELDYIPTIHSDGFFYTRAEAETLIRESKAVVVRTKQKGNLVGALKLALVDPLDAHLVSDRDKIVVLKGFTLDKDSGQGPIDRDRKKAALEAILSGREVSEGLVKFAREFHPIVDKIVEVTTEKTGFTIDGEKVIVSDYPYGCITSALATKYLLERLYGDRLTVQLVKVSHPKMKKLEIEIHVANIITDNITGRKYFMSFFEGVWDDSYPHERTREIKVFLPFKERRTDCIPTPGYIKWFKEQKFPPVFFEFKKDKDITKTTNLTVISQYKEEIPLVETDAIFNYIGSIVNFDEWRALLELDINKTLPSRSEGDRRSPSISRRDFLFKKVPKYVAAGVAVVTLPVLIRSDTPEFIAAHKITDVKAFIAKKMQGFKIVTLGRSHFNNYADMYAAQAIDYFVEKNPDTPLIIGLEVQHWYQEDVDRYIREGVAGDLLAVTDQYPVLLESLRRHYVNGVNLQVACYDTREIDPFIAYKHDNDMADLLVPAIEQNPQAHVLLTGGDFHLAINKNMRKKYPSPSLAWILSNRFKGEIYTISVQNPEGDFGVVDMETYESVTIPENDLVAILMKSRYGATHLALEIKNSPFENIDRWNYEYRKRYNSQYPVKAYDTEIDINPRLGEVIDAIIYTPELKGKEKAPLSSNLIFWGVGAKGIRTSQ